jgi:proteasome assembly chaperone (PAC2) family protein
MRKASFCRRRKNGFVGCELTRAICVCTVACLFSGFCRNSAVIQHLNAMAQSKQFLNDPWLLAAWPGMGAVAISADYYLMAKLGMHLLAEIPAPEFFDLEHVEVKGGLIQSGRLPRSRMFLWHDPNKRHDLIVFVGEAQPASKGGAFCTQIIRQARDLGVRRVFTFAAMATQMRPEEESRVFGAAIDNETLAEFRALDLHLLEEGQISGLNGVLLGIAADHGMSGGCLLGEMPQVFSQFPFPKASLAVLEAFTKMAGIEIDLSELESQATQVEQGLAEFLQRLEQSFQSPGERDETLAAEPSEGSCESLGSRDQRRVEALFEIARTDRSRAYELKQELDRLKIFAQYEDRFLDLFKDPN